MGRLEDRVAGRKKAKGILALCADEHTSLDRDGQEAFWEEIRDASLVQMPLPVPKKTIKKLGVPTIKDNDSIRQQLIEIDDLEDTEVSLWESEFIDSILYKFVGELTTKQKDVARGLIEKYL